MPSSAGSKTPAPLIACLGDLMSMASVNFAPPKQNATAVVHADREMQVGGPAINVARHLKGFGCQVRLVGIWGEDTRLLLDSALKQSNLLQETRIRYRAGAGDHLFYFEERSSGRHWSGYVLRPYDEEDIEHFKESIADADIVIFTGSRHSALQRMYAVHQKPSVTQTVVFNPSYAIATYAADELRSAFEGCDWMFLNQDERNSFKRIVEYDAVAEASSQQRIVVTRGNKGAMLVTSGRKHTLGASEVTKKQSSIGAGDVLLAATIKAALTTDDPKEQLRCGVRAASLYLQEASLMWSSVIDKT